MPHRILTLATEWLSGQGGLSTLNRLLCQALAAAGAEVWCRVPTTTAAERAAAAAVGVNLISAPPAPGAHALASLTHRSGLPPDTPDVIIGHGRVTGPHARVLAEDILPGTAWYLVTHTIPDESEWHRPDEQEQTAAHRAEERTQLEWRQLGSAATRVVTFGGRLYGRALLELSAHAQSPPPLRLDPGFDIVDPVRHPPRGGPARILISGRLDDGVKGVDIAAAALRHVLQLGDPRATSIELVARGIDTTRSAEFIREVKSLAGPGLRVIPRSYTAEVNTLRDDLLQASLLLMPSRAEPFGLMGLEAIVAGTPVLVSDRSGLGELLVELLPVEDARRMVIPVTGDDTRDALVWGHAIAAVIRDVPAAFANLDRCRQILAAKRTWAMAAAGLLDSMNPHTPR